LLVRLPAGSFLPNIDLLVREIEYVLMLLTRLGSHGWIQLMDHIVLMNVKIIHHLDLLNIINVQGVLHFTAPTPPNYSFWSCINCSLLQRILIQILLVKSHCDKFEIRWLNDIFEGVFANTWILQVYFFHRINLL
jgi:hypothetical protein